MRLLIVASIALLPGAAAAAAPVRAPAQRLQTTEKCPQTTSHYAWDRNRPLQPRKLGELPDANAYAAVYRVIGGCEVPVLVRYRISGRR